MANKETENTFSLAMASDEKYFTYLRTAVNSIRRYNNNVPINVYSCVSTDSLSGLSDVVCNVRHVDVPQRIKDSLGEGTEKLEHTLTRVAKLESMRDKRSNQLMYVDSDIIAFDDLEKITTELGVADSDKPVVYMLLRRPHLLSIKGIGWLYFQGDSVLSPQQKADLVNDTFAVDYSAQRLQDIRCWNGGIIYGSTEGVNALANLWGEYYTKMLTEKNKDSFIPNDQLCLWLAVDRLESELIIRELPLAWNYMPGHALEEIMAKTDPSAEEIKKSLEGVRILHFAQNKTDKWAQVLIDEVNSNKQ